MDASKLRNSCICGNTLPYLECCGRYADPHAGGAPADSVPGRRRAPAGPVAALRGQDCADADALLYHGFRHGLHELSMALFPLRALYQAYWEKLTRDDYPHDLLMEDPDYGRSVIENFFWDHFVQYSDARPILRTARELEGRDLRLAHDIIQWSYSPLWFYRVLERNPKTARLANIGNGKVHSVYHAGGIPGTGDALLTRILPFRGREFCSHAILGFGVAPAAAEGPPRPPEPGRAESLLRAGCRELGVKTSVNLRPDVHCEEWRRHGAAFLALWRAEIYDIPVGRPVRGSGPSPEFLWTPDARVSVSEAMASAPDALSKGAGAWDLRYRSLRLARLEAKEEGVSVTLSDPAFRKHALDWLRARLGGRIAAEKIGSGAMPEESPASRDAWAQAPMDALNGQTPLQACTHDWGRRRLQSLFKEMEKQGVDVASLRIRLGL